MKGLFKLIVIVVILSGAAGPFGTSYLVERQYNQMIAHLNSMANGAYTISGTFHNGYLSSTAQTTITFKNNMQPIVFDHIINQGPVVFNLNGALGPNKFVPQGLKMAIIATKIGGDMGKNLDQLLNNQQAYSIITVLGFNGDQQTLVQSQPISLTVKDGSINWQGLTGNFRINKAMTDYQGNVSIPGFEYTQGSVDDKNSQTLKIKDIKGDMAVNTDSNKHDFNFTTSNITLADHVNTLLSVDNMKVTLAKMLTDKLGSFDIKFNFDKINYSDSSFGPIEVNLDLKNIDLNAMKSLKSMKGEIQAAGAEKQLPSGADYSAALLNLLHAHPSIDSDVKITTPDGNIKLTLHFDVGGADLKDTNPDSIMPTINFTNNMRVAVKLLHSALVQYATQQLHSKERMYFIMNKSSNTTNPYSLSAEQMQPVIEDWIKKLLDYLQTHKFIVFDTTDVKTDIEYDKDVLNINGNIVTQDDLIKVQPLLDVTVPGATPPAATTAPTTSAPAKLAPGAPTAPAAPATPPAPAATAPAPTPVAPATTQEVTPPPATTVEPETH